MPHNVPTSPWHCHGPTVLRAAGGHVGVQGGQWLEAVLRAGTVEGAQLLAAHLDAAVDGSLGGPRPKWLRLGDVAGDASLCRAWPALSQLASTPSPLPAPTPS